MSAPVVIIGSGLAGYHVAKEFRKHDAGTPLQLLTADGGDFYSKPMLSNALGRGMTPAQLASAGPEQMAMQLKAEIRSRTTVTAIDVAARTLRMVNGAQVWSRLVLAVGASQISLPIEGDAAGGILTVNSLEDFARFSQAVASARRVAVIGPGLIGCEFANDLCSTGRKVTVIGPDATPLGRLLPPQAGALLQQALADAGIEWRLGTSARAITRRNQGYILDLDDGSDVEADVVLSAIGLRPNVALAEQAGIRAGRGILVDRFLRTSAEDIFAIGDCAEIDGRVMPFVMPIMFGARALGRTLAGDPARVEYPVMPVVVKTPAHPVVVCPPAPGSDGEWEEARVGNGMRALFRSKEGVLLGFALTGEAVAEKQKLTAQVTPLFG
jgi:rubredoxin---NAD+ reductase